MAFKRADENKSGTVTTDELKTVFRELLPKDEISLRDITTVLKLLDKDGSGNVSETEFVKAFERVRHSVLERVHRDDFMSQEEIRGKFI